jgi:hypothetical protein
MWFTVAARALTLNDVRLSDDAHAFLEKFARKGLLGQSGDNARRKLDALNARHSTVQNHLIVRSIVTYRMHLRLHH